MATDDNTTLAKIEAWADGYNTGAGKGRISSNPYGTHSALYAEWRVGFEEGKKDDPWRSKA